MARSAPRSTRSTPPASPEAVPEETTFANHRGVVPMLWVFFSIALVEMVAVHLFVTLRWPVVGWPLTILSAATLVWIVAWIRSWKRLPHRLENGVLTLNMGRMRKIAVPLEIIRAVTPVDGERLKAPGTLNLVPIAYPNRMIELTQPTGKRGAVRIAVRVDDRAAFDAAMSREPDGVPSDESAR